MDKKQKLNESLANTMGVVVILFSFIISYFIYTQILGSPDNFIDGDPDNQPKEGFYLGTIYKGGKIVILQITFMVILLTYSIERALSLFRARGKKFNVSFANTIKENLGVNDLNAALTSCNNQKGAVANVVFKGLNSYMLESPQELRPVVAEDALALLGRGCPLDAGHQDRVGIGVEDVPGGEANGAHRVRAVVHRECDAAAAFRAHHLVVRCRRCAASSKEIAKISHKKQIFLRDPQNFSVSCHFSRRRGDYMGRVFES